MVPLDRFKHFLDNPLTDWLCAWCCLPFGSVDLGKEGDLFDKADSSLIERNQNGYANNVVDFEVNYSNYPRSRSSLAEDAISDILHHDKNIVENYYYGI